MQRIFSIVCVVALVAILATGCNSNVPLKGKVTFTDNDEPLTQGTVAFLKDGTVSRGTIQPDGTFVIGTEKVSDGLPPGTYQVYITGSDIVIPIGEYGANSYEPQIDKKYESPDTSGLTVTVDASTKTFDIKVDRIAPGAR
jgi:flagellar hook assembly protein FlgD